MRNIITSILFLFSICLSVNAQTSITIQGNLGFLFPAFGIEDYPVHFILEDGTEEIAHTNTLGEFEINFSNVHVGEIIYTYVIDPCIGDIIEGEILVEEEDSVVEIEFEVCSDIFPPNECVANFNYEPTAPYSREIHFFDLSTAPDGVSNWSWDFGDGFTSNEQNPIHSYGQAGEYVVSLSIQSDSCEAHLQQIIYVIDGEDCICNDYYDPVCVATPSGGFLQFANPCFAECEGFTADIYFPCTDTGENCFASFFYEALPPEYNMIQFINTSEGSYDLVTWDFGDGTTIEEFDPLHIYEEAGEYLVTMTITDGVDCTESISLIIHVGDGSGNCFCPEYYAPVCVFDDAGQLVQFSNDCWAACEGYGPDTWFHCELGGHYGDCFAFYEYEQDEEEPLTVYFNNLSAYQQDTMYWYWEFGDGTDSREFQPIHTYEEAGIYEVTLYMENDSCYNIITLPIFVFEDDIWYPEDCQAIFDFILEPNTENTYLFNDHSFGEVIAWEWDFGDGTRSTEPNPIHQFEENGFYPVTLGIMTAEGCLSSTTLDIHVGGIVDPGACQALYGFFQTAVSTFTINFEDYSLGEVVAWEWNFGDGTISHESNPTHIYEEEGEYLVSLSITTFLGCTSTIAYPILVWGEDDDWYPIDCQTNFFFTPTDEPLTIQFEDLSHGEVVDWAWHFGDETYAYEQHPVHTYTEEGVYLVLLETATADGCYEDFWMEVWVGSDLWDELPDGCQALFTAVLNENEVSFQDQSEASDEIVNWFWDFGDGNAFIGQNPVHTYAEVGVYEVSLVIFTVNGCNSIYQMTIDLSTEDMTGNIFAFASTSVDENLATIETFTLAPNPVSDVLRLEFNENPTNDYLLQIIHLNGQLIEEQVLKAGHTQSSFNVQHLAPACYFIRIQNGNEVRTERFIKI